VSRSLLVAIAAAAATVAAACGPRGATPSEPTPAAPVDAAPAPAPVAVTPPPPDAAPVPLPLDRDMPALAARLVELYRAAADALVAAGTDCGRASTELVAVRDRFRDVRDAVSRVVADGRSGQLEPELDRHRDPIAAALTRMQPTLDACRSDARLDAALDGLAGGG
jgi:hypothetical protein